MDKSILKSNVNGLLALLCVGTFALGAWLIVWHAAFGENPIANAMWAQMSADNQNY